MIQNHEELAVVRGQLRRAEDALDSLHKDVFDRNARNYAVFAESYVDVILQLRTEIDAFLGISPPQVEATERNGHAANKLSDAEMQALANGSVK